MPDELFQAGSLVRHQQTEQRLEVLGFDGADESGESRLLLRNTLTDEIVSVAKYLLKAEENIEPQKTKKSQMGVASQLLTASPEEIHIATEKLELLSPLLNSNSLHQDINALAVKMEVHRATIYRWVKRLQENPENQLSALMRIKEQATRESRLKDKLVKGIIDATLKDWIEESKKQEKRITITQIIRRINRRCTELKLQSPNHLTIRAYIRKLNAEDIYLVLKGTKTARQLTQIHSNGVTILYPYDTLQIDHTPFDLELVDPTRRDIVLGKANLTLAIDVFSRMVAGMYISFDPIGSLSVGACLVQAMLPKYAINYKYPEIQSPWPCEGKPRVVFVDNAKEFRGNMLEQTVLEYGFQIQFRPAGHPNVAGHIERAFRTYLKEVHQLPGTTASNPQKKTGHEGIPSLTLDELEHWFHTFILDVYHLQKHSAINMPPIEKWRQGIRGTDDTPARGIVRLSRDPARVRLDFLPLIKDVTIQAYGIRRDYIHYYDDVLRTFRRENIEVTEANAKKKFIVRRDPRNISVLYLYDEKNDIYHTIHSRTHLPPISLWEWRKAKKAAILAGNKLEELNEDIIYAALLRMDNIVSNAQAETKRVITEQAKLKQGLKKRKEEGLASPLPVFVNPSDNSSTDSFSDEEIQSYG